ncbi:MAG TPA: SLC13 family permease [Pseudonocardia sp.]|nr:SLC13 family permease [Pseudonocardia sp.]
MLWAAGVIDLDQAVAGFGDPTVILIAALFVVSEGLDATGVTTWVGRQLGARAGGSRTALLAMIMLLAAGVTALINLNGSVAALLPIADRPVSEGELAVGDRLTVVGAPDGVTRVGADHGLELRWSQ